MLWKDRTTGLLMIVLLLLGATEVTGQQNTYQCEGTFRAGHECDKAVDGDWMTSAVPDAYGGSVAVIESHTIPSGISTAKWRFKVLRNTDDIKITAYYWNYDEGVWAFLYEVPLDSEYRTYMEEIPANGLLSSPLKTKMFVKNASSPLMSGEYFEGVVDWIYPEPGYACEGTFRAGHECDKAVDGDWMTSAVPDAYGDSVAVIESYTIPSGISDAKWRFKVLRNTADIKITAYYWNYDQGDWTLLYDVPLDLDYRTYMKEIPANGLLSSPLKTKMFVKNAISPLMSGEYFEGAVDWVYPNPSPSYECERQFWSWAECWRAVDGDTTTDAAPYGYNDSAAVIEYHDIPPGACAAYWQFRVLNNNDCIEVRADFWDYAKGDWALLYDVPLDLDYQTYTKPIPANALLASPLKTKMHMKNGGPPCALQSANYLEGVVDWVYPEPSYACEGMFRAGYECAKAVDGDTMTSAVPDAYGDSVAVIESYPIPEGVDGAKWLFRVLGNNTDIEVTAYYWNYEKGDWDLLYDVPLDLNYRTYMQEIPANGLLSSPLKTRMHVKNAFGMSGEYFEGAVDWLPYTYEPPIGCCSWRVGDANGAGGDEPTIGDVSVMIDAKFITGSCDGILNCMAEADINQSGGANPTCDDITIGDISTLIDYLFITGSSLGLPNCL